MRFRLSTAVLGAIVALGPLGAARDARAFCGFYVSGADAKLTNDATQVVLMRDGTRTVLSMQNNYQGPPQDFAMVIPVPVVLQKENVKTLERGVFDRIDKLTAPRLVEYWEQDPCPRPMPMMEASGAGGLAYRSMPKGAPMPSAPPPLVKIEAQFSVGEYDIVVLSATDATALDTWLRQNSYKIPAGAEPYLRPYVQMGMKFFVAKVNAAKVKFERVGNGPEQAILSPLRFHYDSEAFNLPIRLGLINSAGTQPGRSSAPSTRRSSTRRWPSTHTPSSPSTRGRPPRAIRVPRHRSARGSSSRSARTCCRRSPGLLPRGEARPSWRRPSGSERSTTSS